MCICQFSFHAIHLFILDMKVAQKTQIAYTMVHVSDFGTNFHLKTDPKNLCLSPHIFSC